MIDWLLVFNVQAAMNLHRNKGKIYKWPNTFVTSLYIINLLRKAMNTRFYFFLEINAVWSLDFNSFYIWNSGKENECRTRLANLVHTTGLFQTVFGPSFLNGSSLYPQNQSKSNFCGIEFYEQYYRHPYASIRVS